MLVVLWSATGAAGLPALVQLADADHVFWAVLSLSDGRMTAELAVAALRNVVSLRTINGKIQFQMMQRIVDLVVRDIIEPNGA